MKFLEVIVSKYLNWKNQIRHREQNYHHPECILGNINKFFIELLLYISYIQLIY